MKATSPLPSPSTTTGNDASSDNEATKSRPTEHHQKKRGGTKRKQNKKQQQFAGIEELEIERYDKLFYQAQKQLKSKVKQVKTFLVQKEIRKQKQKQGNQKKATDDASSSVVESMKKIDIDVVTQQALRRLGLYHCNPRLKYDEEQQQQQQQQHENEEEDEEISDSDDGDSHSGSIGAVKKEEEQNDVKDKKNMPTKGKKKHSRHGQDSALVIPPTLIGSTNEENDPTIRYLPSILDHKKFVECMEEWNTKVTQHRRFCMQLEERQRRRSNPSLFGPDSRSKKKRKKNQQQQQKTTSMFSSNTTAAGVTAIKDSVNEQPTALFGRLGGGDYNDSDGGFSENDGDGAENSFSVYGPGANLTDGDVFGGVPQPPQRKNRKGQRARRAKAAAIEAKKQGKSGREYYYESLNWRPKKQQQQQQQEVSDDHYQHQQYQSYDNVSMGSARGDNKNRQKKYDGGREETISSSRSSSGAPPPAATVDPASAHPSWAAKQSQKTGIVAFKGTKITFD